MVENKFKVCLRCEKELPIDSFRIIGARKNGTISRYNTCMPCKDFIANKKRIEYNLQSNPHNYIKCVNCSNIYSKRFRLCRKCGTNNNVNGGEGYGESVDVCDY